MKITTKGQVTIPLEIREELGLLPNTEVEFEIEGNVVKIKKKKVGKFGKRGKALVDGLKGTATSRLTTDQIMALTRG